MCLCIHLPVFVDNLHSRQLVAAVILAVQLSAVVDHACEHVNIPEYTAVQGVHGSREPGYDIIMQGNWYRHRYHNSVCRAVVTINVGLAQTCSSNNYLLWDHVCTCTFMNSIKCVGDSRSYLSYTHSYCSDILVMTLLHLSCTRS